MRLTPVMVLVLAAACSSSSPKATTPSPAASIVVTPTATPSAGPPAGVTVETGTVSFTLPDHNISCRIDAATARCDVAKHSWKATPKPSDCYEKWGFGLQYTLGGSAYFFCANDSVLGAARVLHPGRGIRIGMVQCQASTVAITCRGIDARGGFTVSASNYRIT